MIDLSRSRANLLVDIDSEYPPRAPLRDITDPHVMTSDARVRLRGHTREDLFPVLKVALSERFSGVPRPILVRDLLMPLKHALGNAYKHGNRRDTAKGLFVEALLTPKGALIEVTDEGDGFDVDLTVRLLREQQTYFDHHGAGLRDLQRATSAVTWENGGRTLLLCFRSSLDGTDATVRHAAEERGEDRALRRALHPVWVHTCLSRELHALQNGAQLESCRGYVGRGPAGDDCGIRYVLRITEPDSGRAETRILTGRFHADEAVAAADLRAAVRLHDGPRWSGLRIPAPVLRPTAEPRLVLYDFDPWMNLWQYLAYRGSLKALRHSASRAGEALAILHGSDVVLPRVEPDSLGARLEAVVASAQNALARLPGAADLVARFRAGMERIHDEPLHEERVRAPIHGALGWSCIHYGVDGYFYFYGFESCQQAEPAIDVGGFAADLLRFTLAGNDSTAYALCLDDLLAKYNAAAARPLRPADLPVYIALALGERLRGVTTAADARELLRALDTVAPLSTRWQ